MAGPWIIAHRGASAGAPENTLAAVRLAWELGADAVEVDVHRTMDGRAVAIHDPDTRRTTGVNLRVAGATLAQLQALDAGGFKGAQWAGERIPSLREVLAAVPPGKRLVIELKVGVEVLEALEEDLRLSRALPLESIVVIAFDRAVAVLAKARLPRTTALWLGDPRRHGLRWRPAEMVRRMAAQARELGLDGLDLFAHRCLTAKLVEEIHKLGLQLFVWTADHPSTGARLLRAGVDGLTTNRPDAMIEVRQRFAGPREE